MKSSAVKILIFANVAVFVLQSLSPEVLEGLFALWPLQAIDPQWHFQVWQIVTYAFLHDTHNMAHLVFNMLGLWVFGTGIEQYVGPRRLLACYFASVVTAALTQLFVPVLYGCSRLCTQRSSSTWGLPGLRPGSHILPTWAAWWAAPW